MDLDELQSRLTDCVRENISDAKYWQTRDASNHQAQLAKLEAENAKLRAQLQAIPDTPTEYTPEQIQEWASITSPQGSKKHT